MPINYNDYTANWKTEIRPAVMQRAGEVKDGKKIKVHACCEECGVKNHAMIIRGEGAEFEYCADWLLSQQNGYGFYKTWGAGDGRIKVVLTIAHLDHDKSNNDVNIDRLRAWCQRCHLKVELREDCDAFRPKSDPDECGTCQTDGHYLCGGCANIAPVDKMELHDNKEKYYRGPHPDKGAGAVSKWSKKLEEMQQAIKKRSEEK